jgi:hypothetical protein
LIRVVPIWALLLQCDFRYNNSTRSNVTWRCPLRFKNSYCGRVGSVGSSIIAFNFRVTKTPPSVALSIAHLLLLWLRQSCWDSILVNYLRRHIAGGLSLLLHLHHYLLLLTVWWHLIVHVRGRPHLALLYTFLLMVVRVNRSCVRLRVHPCYLLRTESSRHYQTVENCHWRLILC